MKINIFQTLAAIGASMLMSYGFYTFSHSDSSLTLSVGSFIFLYLTLMMAIGIDYGLPRTGVMVKTLSGIFFFIAIISNLLFSLTNFSKPLYVVANGLLLLIHLSLSFSISKQRQ